MTRIPQPNTIQKEKDAEISDVKNKLPVPTLHTPENFENRIQTNRRPRLFFLRSRNSTRVVSISDLETREKHDVVKTRKLVSEEPLTIFFSPSGKWI